MIFPEKWAKLWVDSWNNRDLDALLALYASSIELRSPFAKVFDVNGIIIGKEQLRTYWGEAMRRMPNLRLELIAVYSGHMALALHYREHTGRNVIETVLFDERDLAVFETACLDGAR